jgi:sterol desaturase/sphingolipid hydroxylase (fatty acid hydroxylase superfamily)
MVGAIGTFAAGLFAWTFIEYLIHGWLSHTFRTFAGPLHAVHHRDPGAVFTIGAWLPIATAYLVGLAIFCMTAGMIFFSGIVAGFIAYETIHYRIHFRAPRAGIESHLRARHLAHHQSNPDATFGVTSELWDLIFGTEPLGAEAARRRALAAMTAPLSGRANLYKLAGFIPRRALHGNSTPSRSISPR